MTTSVMPQLIGNLQKTRSIVKLLQLFNGSDIVLTQGFIGSTDENESTTLGREGSDYTAAVFANSVKRKNQTIWKRCARV